MSSRHSKIVCTLGPATNSPRMIRRLLEAGMDVARLNFSHGTHETHAQSIAMVHAEAAELGKTVGILADLQGPKIRTGALAGGGTVNLRSGQQFIITTAKILGDSTRVNTTFRPLPREVKAGDRILLSDGLIELRVEKTRGQEVICRVVNGGALGEHKGINLPGVKLRVPALTPKDREDLRFALAHNVDFIAASFVRRPEDVLLAKALIRRAKKDTPVISKLEKPEAIENLEGILRVSDGVMVARGDLGVEMNPETVPVVQKNIIARAREFRRPVITATQMLESMTQNPRPTRAEASDVANAIPKLFPHLHIECNINLSGVLPHSAFPALLAPRYRPLFPIVAFSPEAPPRRRMSFSGGLPPRHISDIKKIDGLADLAEKRL